MWLGISSPHSREKAADRSVHLNKTEVRWISKEFKIANTKCSRS